MYIYINIILILSRCNSLYRPLSFNHSYRVSQLKVTVKLQTIYAEYIYLFVFMVLVDM